jgi:hypothetical protein
MMLVLDEMHVKEGLVYDKHPGELAGFVDLGEINNHLMCLQKSLDGNVNALKVHASTDGQRSFLFIFLLAKA